MLQELLYGGENHRAFLPSLAGLTKQNSVLKHLFPGFKDENEQKKHEATHTGENQFDCGQCDKIFRSLEEMNQHKRSHVCEHFKKGLCKFGSRGMNSHGYCLFKHPRPCMYNETPAGCKKGDNCDFLHRVRRVRDFNGNGPHFSDANDGARGFRLHQQGNPGNMSFLGDGFLKMLDQRIDQYFQQKIGQDQSNGNRMRGPQQWR